MDADQFNVVPLLLVPEAVSPEGTLGGFGQELASVVTLIVMLWLEVPEESLADTENWYAVLGDNPFTVKLVLETLLAMAVPF